jgi:hypothetical protein
MNGRLGVLSLMVWKLFRSATCRSNRLFGSSTSTALGRRHKQSIAEASGLLTRRDHWKAGCPVRRYCEMMGSLLESSLHPAGILMIPTLVAVRKPDFGLIFRDGC